jgi:hypothetical protein
MAFLMPAAYCLDFKQVVIWGHKLHSHTHSYIHAAFDKTFRSLGHKTLWLDRTDDISHIDFAETLFITEGQVDQNIPLRDDCWYILHNCDQTKYKDLIAKNRCIFLQVYTHDVLTRDAQKVEPCIYYDIPGKIIYMPWATDLLPHEIDAIKASMTREKSNFVSFIGTIGGGYFGNDREVAAFRKAAAGQKISFVHKTHLDLAETITMTQQSYMAPAIQGAWQIEKGYIPCRIFKNISYGTFGITNSQTVWELFDRKIIYNPDCYQLFYDAQKALKTLTLSDLMNLMDFVKERHTYVNRINHLLCFFKHVS